MRRIVDEYGDPRLVRLYDRFNPFAADTDYYLALAAETPKAEVVDLGCGTGLLAVELARCGHRVTGVEPSAPMLGVARARPDGDLVRWVHGDAAALQLGSADLLLMTGHVAQVFVDDEAWAAALLSAHRALRPGGRLAFESRDPAARAWESWTREASYGRDEDPELGPFDGWFELREAAKGLVRFDGVTRLSRTGEELWTSSTLRFRTEEELVASVGTAGFTVELVHGDWDGRPAGEGRELILVARR